MHDDLKIPAFLDRRTRPAWLGKCEAQRQVSEYQLGNYTAVTGTAGKNPYPPMTNEWFEYEGGFDLFIKNFERA